MNASSLPPMPVIKDWLAEASQKLSKIGIPSATLDAELILAYVYGQDRTYLHAHHNEEIDSSTLMKANSCIELRLRRTPIAYVINKKYFYGREFIVTPATLIPRPESEDIITILKKICPTNTKLHLADVGTGSGCLGITAKLELPNIDVTLSDISDEALSIAMKNANALSVDVRFVHSDLLQNYSTKLDIIIANLPYVDKTWKRSPETNFEPELALFAEDNGMSVIKTLIDQATKKLSNDSYLIIEADPDQHQQLIDYAKKMSFTHNEELTDKNSYAITFQYSPKTETRQKLY